MIIGEYQNKDPAELSLKYLKQLVYLKYDSSISKRLLKNSISLRIIITFIKEFQILCFLFDKKVKISTQKI